VRLFILLACQCIRCSAFCRCCQWSRLRCRYDCTHEFPEQFVCCFGLGSFVDIQGHVSNASVCACVCSPFFFLLSLTLHPPHPTTKGTQGVRKASTLNTTATALQQHYSPPSHTYPLTHLSNLAMQDASNEVPLTQEERERVHDNECSITPADRRECLLEIAAHH
jgi:hypothetical protein